MRKRHIRFISILFSFMFFVSSQAGADIEWSLRKQLKLDAAPADVAASADGKWLFVLSPGEVAVYSVPEYKVVNRIPIDKVFDRLAYSDLNNTLIVSSGAEKTVKIIELEVIHRFSIQDLPFKGGKNAPVTVLVFSDYQ